VLLLAPDDIGAVMCCRKTEAAHSDRKEDTRSRQYEISQGPVATPAGPSGYHLVALLEFDDLAAIQAAFGSAEGQAAVADVQNFATGGADIVMFDTRPA
jgi:uncharacterized protein (TIGR02118 family)